MKKILDFLEKNVQWFVLAGGVAYVLYVAWAFVLTPPVLIVGIGSAALPPGKVDESIQKTVAADLEMKMRPSALRPAPPIRNYSDEFIAMMRGPTVQPWTDAAVVFQQSPMIKLDGSTGPAPLVEVERRPGEVEKLPVLTAAVIGPMRSGISSIIRAPQGGAVAQAATIDKNWVTVRYSIDAKSLVSALEAAKIPQHMFTVTFLTVSTERQELRRDGTWSDPVVVPPLSNQETRAYPAANAARDEQTAFVRWASERTAQILQPAFYTVARGDKWNAPGEGAQIAAPAPPKPPFNPANFITAPAAELMKLTPEERRLVAAERTRQNRGRGVARPAPGDPAAAGEPDGAIQRNPAANDPDRPIHFQVAEPGQPGEPIVAEVAVAENEVPAPGQWPNFPVPVNTFDPRTWSAAAPKQETIIGWVHDETAIPGRTYRYRVSYKIKNPVTGFVDFVKDPALAAQFDLHSPPSNWSEPIEVAATVYFWTARARPNGQVTMQVFRLQGGTKKSKTFDVMPGDAIGRVDAGVDFTTGWSLVDVRKDLRNDEELYVLLMDPNGAVQRRDVRADAQDPKYQQFKQEIAAAGP